MFRYVAFVWNTKDADASRVAQGLTNRIRRSGRMWECRLCTPGMLVFDNELAQDCLAAYFLPDDRGIILGQLFLSSSETCSREISLSRETTEQVVKSSGGILVANYWGKYVAFFYDQVQDAHHVIRDCSGALPCYRTNVGRVEVIFSDIEDLDCLEIGKFDVDWSYISAFICSSDFQVRKSGLKNVQEVLAGERLSISANGTAQSLLWDPRKVCGGEIITDINEASEALRKTAQGCIDAWASRYANIALSLSGGFDSAVVLGLLRNCPRGPHITCINRYGDEEQSDERIFARAAARHANAELRELPFSAGRPLLDLRTLDAPRTAKPTVQYVFGLAEYDYRSGFLQELQAQALWTGQGGDHLFLQFPTTFGAADYIRDHGVSVGLAAAVRDAARISRESYWGIIREAFLVGWMGRIRKGAAFRHERGCFLTERAAEAAVSEETTNPWSQGVEHLPAGKQFQISQLSELLHRHRPMPGTVYAQEHHPLISQPLIELCLRLPNYILTTGGKSRGLARIAFRDWLPPEIVNRESKGATSVFFINEIRKCQAFVCDLLLDGVLASQGIVDAGALKPYITHSVPLRSEQLSPLFATISAEIWARTWLEGKQRRAVA
jgi:asparagine synthase (glutamine-hydrolysing)